MSNPRPQGGGGQATSLHGDSGCSSHRHPVGRGLTRATTALAWCGDPRLGGDRRGTGGTVDVVPPAAPGHRSRRPRRRRGAGWRVAAPLGLVDDARRARHRGAAGCRAPFAGGGPGQRGGSGVLRRLRAHPRPAGPAAGPGGPGRRGRRRAARGAGRGPALDDPHDRQRDRHVVAAVRAGVPGRRDLPWAPAASPRLPRTRGVPRSTRGRRGRRRVRRAAARRDRARRGGHALGDPAGAGLAHRRLHSRRGPGRRSRWSRIAYAAAYLRPAS